MISITSPGHAAPGKYKTSGWLKDIALLGAVWIAAVLITRPMGDFPINDDWVYAAAVRSLVLTGRLEIYSFSSANVGPQIYWGALFTHLFGLSFTSLRWSTLVLGLAGGIASYALFREVWQDRVGAVFLAFAVLLNPLYFSLSHSFMTDVPFFALMATSMALIARGILRERSTLLWAGVLIAMFTMLLRQFAVIVLAAFAVAYIVLRGLSFKNVILSILPLASGLLLNWLFTRWLIDTGRKPFAGGIPSLMPSLDTRFLWTTKATMFSALSYSGLLLIPLAICYFPRKDPDVGKPKRQITWTSIGILSLALGYGYWRKGMSVPIGENVLSWYGVGPLTNGDTLMHNQNLPLEPFGTSLAWTGITVLAIVCSACLLVSAGLAATWVVSVRASVGRSENRARLAMGSFIATCGAAYLAILATLANGFTVLDRYMLPLMLVGGLALPLLDRGGTRSAIAVHRRWFAAASLAICAVFSVMATHDFLRWSQVRWSASQALLAEGIAADRIDGGYEFNGWYLYDPRYRPIDGKNWWWVHDDEFQISSGPIAGYAEYRRYPVERWWNNGLSDVFVLRRDR